MQRYYVECILSGGGKASSILSIKASCKREAIKLVKVQYKTIEKIVMVHETRPFLLNNHAMSETNDYHSLSDGRKAKNGRVRILG